MRSPTTEVENLKIRSVLNAYAGICKLGKSDKQRKLWPIFLKNPSV